MKPSTMVLIPTLSLACGCAEPEPQERAPTTRPAPPRPQPDPLLAAYGETLEAHVDAVTGAVSYSVPDWTTSVVTCADES